MHRRRLKVAQPCNARWDEMRGSAAVRLCATCETKVHNLSALTEREAKALLSAPPPRLCVRYLSDRAGRVIFRKDGSHSPIRQIAASVVTTSLLSACTPTCSYSGDDVPFPTDASAVAALRLQASELTVHEPASEPDAGSNPLRAIPDAGSPRVLSDADVLRESTLEDSSLERDQDDSGAEEHFVTMGAYVETP